MTGPTHDHLHRSSAQILALGEKIHGFTAETLRELGCTCDPIIDVWLTECPSVPPKLKIAHAYGHCPLRRARRELLDDYPAPFLPLEADN